MHLLDFFAGGERSWIEYAQALFVLGMLVYSVRRLIADFSNLNETFLINALFVGLLFLMLGRELSYGKYHGIDDRSLRSIMRILSIVAVLGLWASCAVYAKLRIRSAVSAAFRRMWGEWFLLASTVVIFVVSQIVDKDFIFTIRPPEIAQAVEESLESIAFLMLLWGLMRLNAKPFNQKDEQD